MIDEEICLSLGSNSHTDGDEGGRAFLGLTIWTMHTSRLPADWHCEVFQHQV